LSLEGKRKESELTLGNHPDPNRDDAARAAVKLKRLIKAGLTPQGFFII
jgi:hypothetical protein